MTRFAVVVEDPRYPAPFFLPESTGLPQIFASWEAANDAARAHPEIDTVWSSVIRLQDLP